MTWAEALDAFEASLDAHHAAMMGLGPMPPAVLGEEDLGPMPPELKTRAQYLLGRCRRLEGELVAAEHAVSAALTALSELPQPGPAYFDLSL
ncbi:MAG TPA: hypothetical protein VFP54_05775 [Acidimicrobiales bacterium]|nr:hypothetical protein [Acidimicrobiales bacterium]